MAKLETWQILINDLIENVMAKEESGFHRLYKVHNHNLDSYFSQKDYIIQGDYILKKLNPWEIGVVAKQKSKFHIEFNYQLHTINWDKSHGPIFEIISKNEDDIKLIQTYCDTFNSSYHVLKAKCSIIAKPNKFSLQNILSQTKHI